MTDVIPIYEQPTDISNEDAIAKVLSERWGWRDVIKLPRLHPLDRAIRRDGSIVGFLEVKCRPGLCFGYGDGYYIAAKKVVAANNMRAALGVETILAVYFPDQPSRIWWTYLRGPYRGVWAGRKDRPDDPCAMEEHASIVWSDFRLVEAA